MLKPGMYISDRYEIIDKVGSGGMADVYKAKCHRLNRFVAIKVLKSEYSDDKNFVKKFRGEAQSAAGLSHPNIVNVYDVGDDNGLHYIVMELVEGITLKSFIDRKGKLEVKEAVGIAIQIAMGMEAAHMNHIIHRDIKPQNIIISREGKVKVTDFGIAKATTSNTITSNAMGSVHYLSPEQARGGYSDEKSDIYSLGVTLYEMLTGQVPFAGDNTVSVALLHIQGEAIPLREINPTIPYSIEKIVQKCMQKKPERRYLSASELMNDLRRSITNPNGDFVVIQNSVITDSPTITISQEDVNTINRAAYAQSVNSVNRRQATGPISKGITSGVNGSRNTNYDADIFDNEEYEDSLVGTDPKRGGIEKQGDEEDELDTVDPRVEKLIFIASIVAAVALVVLVAFLAIKFFNLFDGDKNELGEGVQIQTSVTPTPSEAPNELAFIEIPSVKGLKLLDAEQTLYAKSESFRITYKEEASDEYESGFVIDQYPAKGAEIAENGEILLTISIGSEQVEIPDVYNRTEEQAVKKLEEAKFTTTVVYEYSNDVEADRVIKTSPERLTFGNKGQLITIYVSQGKELSDSIVPTLLSLSQEAATNSLLQNNLVLGEVTTDFSDTYSAGTVMWQSVPGGTALPQGSTVNITISLGKEQVVTTPTPMPTQAPTEAPVVEPEDVTYESEPLTIDSSHNPFEYPGEKGILILELEQDGTIVNIFKGEKSYESFPLIVPSIESDSGSKGTIRMYVGEYVDASESGAVSEGGAYVKYSQYGASWAINFNKVEN